MLADDPYISAIVVFLVALAIILAMQAWKTFAGAANIVSETERGVLYKHGLFVREVGPGRYWNFPGTVLKRLTVNEMAITVPSQEVMSQDRLPIRLSAIAIIKVRDPRKALEASSDGYYSAVYRTLQLALRDLAAEAPLEGLLDQRASLDERLTEKARAGCEEQGCELVRANVRDVMMPAEIRRIATETVRARLEAQAQLERARGEQASLRALNNAARLLKDNPELMNLRILQTMTAGAGKTPPTLVLQGGAGLLPIRAATPGPADGGDVTNEES
ncbi:hypothetical protein DLM45_16180 [Hyphomicrobium methylovorum]|uniref:slipin family protein n=1 Tax=Hyphomicrobium methylovorum TaxID=84 RepID=UPI0015E6BDE7|nr:slipin family protein [Hyphomicrobium methylovorum]MBA2127750.1 hypothetical protein [Hyphomicrobium methylovorum]